MNTEHTSKFYSEILRRLGAVERKDNRLALFYGILATILLTLSLVLLGIVLEEMLSLGVIGRTLLFTIIVLGITGSVGWFVVRALLKMFGVLKGDDRKTLAIKVGKCFHAIHDRLLDALEMYEAKEGLKEFYSLSLIDASFSDLYQAIQPLDFTEAVSDARVKKMRKFVSYAFGVVLLVFVISPSGFFTAFHHIVNYNTSFASELPVQLFVEPGNLEVVRGESVPVLIRTEGKHIRQLSLLTRPEGQLEFDAQLLERGSDSAFHAQLQDVKSPLEYFASVEDIKSDKFKITVLDRPLVRSLQLKVISPSYTRIPPKQLDENVGDISAYPGSRIDIQLLVSKELSTAMMQFNDSTRIQLKNENTHASGSFILKKDKTYHVILKDRNGLQNLNPVEYTIKAIPDEYPTAEILSPGKNVDITGEMKLDLFARIKDDFGFSNLRLAHRLVNSKYAPPETSFSFVNIPLQRNDQSPLDISYHWDLSPLHLVPEDAIAYYVEVFDNDAVSGPKPGKSETYIVRLPSLEEVFSDVSQSQSQSLESMQSVAKQTQQLKRDVEQLQKEIKKNQKDWQQQKKAEEMLQRYEAAKKKLEETAQKLDEAVKKMEENKLLSDETLQKYQELQKLMEQLKSPELQEALKKLQESMKQMTPEQMRQAMNKLQFSEEQFRQSLERTIELLKRIAIEQKLDEVIKRAEELRKQQEALKQQTSQTNPSDEKKRNELAQKQKDLQKQMESLEKETAGLKEQMEEFPKEMPLEEMSKAQSELQQKQLQKKMNSSVMDMQSGNMQSAQQNQQQTEEELQKFEEQMKKVRKSLQDKQMKQIVQQMRKQLENILELSKREENLQGETQNIEPNSQRFRESAEKQQQQMSDLSSIANSMSELAKKSFAVSPEMGKEIGNAMNQMESALQQMEGRNPSGASQLQHDAMSSLNRAAMMMQGSLANMMNGGQSGMGMAGLMGRLGQMAGSQGQINQGTQQAMGQPGEGGQGLSQQQMAAYQRLAGQQSGNQKSLDELSKEAKNAGEYSRLLGDLDQISKEMQEVQTDLAQGNVNPETIKKQERILSRLLESQRSTRERDYEKRRTAEAGKNISHPSPLELDLSTQDGKNRLRQELLKVLEGKYSKDYEELIKKYFEQLEKEEVNQ